MREYIIYIFILILIIVLIVTAYFLWASGKKEQLLRKKTVSKIEYGSVSVFFDRRKNVIVIPYAKDKYGVGRAVEEPQFLFSPYKKDELGNFIRKTLAMCNSENFCSDVKLMKILNSKNWRGFSKGKKSISVYFKKNTGLVFNKTRRWSDGSYDFNSNKSNKVLSCYADNNEIGQTLISLLDR
ncbi:hypothetical protein RBH29_05770 [Herbivorax sp. ANBcel31]|uniref:hypothetical protein n=1 Tax=Herbivorax sp. ANBcel31 TaxID=3069754 RepID=UPI0027B53794|nr:hypothetical protein [Herbivorax sp. ANBcel31]MDQ2085946.1 hypothetical protein [Herbivorax sp. ANBcel31]